MILREQLKVLQHELGEDGDEELSDYEARITALHLPEELHRKLMKEVDRLAKQPFGSARGLRHPQLSGRVSGAAVGQIHP